MPNSLDYLLSDLAAHAARVRENWRDAKYPGFHAFVLAHGRAYSPLALPKKYRRGQPKACFEQMLTAYAKRHVRLIYVEGFAASQAAAFVPTLHAPGASSRGVT